MKILGPLVAIALALGACGAPAGPAGPAKVTVTMQEWSVQMSETSIPSGKVTFVLKNLGKVPHELAILKTDLAHDKIPARATDLKKVEEPGNVGEIEDVDPGTSKEATFELSPGNYVLICNEETHYAAGMHIGFVVK